MSEERRPHSQKREIAKLCDCRGKATDLVFSAVEVHEVIGKGAPVRRQGREIVSFDVQVEDFEQSEFGPTRNVVPREEQRVEANEGSDALRENLE